MKREETVRVLETYYSKPKQVVQMEPKEKIEVKDIQKGSVSLKEFDEFKKLVFSKIENHEKTIKEHENTIKEHENTIKEHEKTIKEMKNNEKQMKSEITNYQNKTSVQENTINDLCKRIKVLEKENKSIEKNTRYQVLSDMISIEDQDLEFNLPLKKRNCFHVKDVQKARDLGGIISLKVLERVIDHDEFQDIIEVKNTLICLEGVIDEWKNDKLKLEDLEKELDVKQNFDEWKSKDHSILIQVISDHFEDDQFKDFKLSQRIKNDFFNLGRSKKNETIDEVYKKIIQSIIMEWKTQNTFDDEMKEFIKLIPNDFSSILQDKKNKFEWKMLPKWNQRREKLKSILRISPPIISKFDGLLIPEK